MQPLVEDLDHSILFQNLSVKSADPALHLLIPVVSNWQVLVETVVGGVARRVVNDGGVSKGKENSSGFDSNSNELVGGVGKHAYVGRPVKCKAKASGVYLWAAAVAATSIANCLMVLSSRYFCSQRTMSASRARILSSRSRRRSWREPMVTPGGWDCLCGGEREALKQVAMDSKTT